MSHAAGLGYRASSSIGLREAGAPAPRETSRRLPLLSLVALLVALLVPSLALAQGSDFERLVYNLANSDDFRVRTQAALALGASKTDKALAPLCTALTDSNTTVRAASAAALGRLSLGGVECLERRLAAETSDVVKTTIQKALELIRSGGGGAEPLFTAATKFYISIGKTTDKTGRTGTDVDGIVRRAMLGRIAQTEGFLAAPSNEAPADAKRRLGAHPAVKAFYLSPGASAPDYSGGNLKVRLEVAMLSYPDKNLIGSFSVNLTEPGVSPGSTQNEDELYRMAAERAVDKFAGIAVNQ